MCVGGGGGGGVICYLPPRRRSARCALLERARCAMGRRIPSGAATAFVGVWKVSMCPSVRTARWGRGTQTEQSLHREAGSAVMRGGRAGRGAGGKGGGGAFVRALFHWLIRDL